MKKEEPLNFQFCDYKRDIKRKKLERKLGLRMKRKELEQTRMEDEETRKGTEIEDEEKETREEIGIFKICCIKIELVF